MTAKLQLTKKQQRESMLSCRTDDKCYCSMGEGAESNTTWCDTDSCFSASKCYCHRNGKKSGGKDGNNNNNSHHQSHNLSSSNSDNNLNHSSSGGSVKNTCKKSSGSNKEKKVKNKSRSADNLGLDYELFSVSGSKAKNIGTSGKQVRAHEALSVKKSVEVAAMFADVKLNQTTDITTLVATNSTSSKDSRKRSGKNSSSSNNKEEYSSKSDMLLHREKSLMKIRLAKTEGYYQAVSARPVSASLEDSLGYLP